jgi:hypothetical protein
VWRILLAETEFGEEEKLIHFEFYTHPSKCLLETMFTEIQLLLLKTLVSLGGERVKAITFDGSLKTFY